MEDSEWVWRTVKDCVWRWMTLNDWTIDFTVAVHWSVRAIGPWRTAKGVEDCARLYAGCTGLYRIIRDCKGRWSCRTVKDCPCGTVQGCAARFSPRIVQTIQISTVSVPRTFRFFYPLWIIAVRADSFRGNYLQLRNFSWSLKLDSAQQKRFSCVSTFRKDGIRVPSVNRASSTWTKWKFEVWMHVEGMFNRWIQLMFKNLSTILKSFVLC
jgi:hypothetical protein